MGGRKGVRVPFTNIKFGTSFDSTHWLSLNPCGLAGVSCSFSVHIFALIVVYEYLISGSNAAQLVFFFFYLPSSLLALTSLFKAWTTDPGAVPMGVRPLVTVKRASSGKIDIDDAAANGKNRRSKKRERGMRRCHKCDDNFKPGRAHHDSVTGRCIVKFDHFCPWVGNAIGALNHKFFVLFIFYTLCTTLLSLLLLLLRAFFCIHTYNIDDNRSNSTNNVITTAPKVSSSTFTDYYHRTLYNSVEENARVIMTKSVTDKINNEQDMYLLEDTLLANSNMKQMAQEELQLPTCDEFYQNKLLIILLIISFVFLTFTSCMLVEQIEAIKTNTGKIARMKMRLNENGSAEYAPVTEQFNEMFGGTSPRVTWHWFLPLTVKFPRSMKKVILGYDWDESMDLTRPYEEPSTLTLESNSSDHRTLDTASSAGDSASDSQMSIKSNNDSNDGMEDVLLHSDSSTCSDIENGRQRIKKRTGHSRERKINKHNLNDIV